MYPRENSQPCNVLGKEELHDLLRRLNFNDITSKHKENLKIHGINLGETARML
jgi:hypothetical protein